MRGCQQEEFRFRSHFSAFPDPEIQEGPGWSVNRDLEIALKPVQIGDTLVKHCLLC